MAKELTVPAPLGDKPRVPKRDQRYVRRGGLVYQCPWCGTVIRNVGDHDKCRRAWEEWYEDGKPYEVRPLQRVRKRREV